MSIIIRGTGSYRPERRLTNADFERWVDTSDEWIVSRTGISERRMLAPEQATSDMATHAGRAALEMAGLQAEDLDLIVIATLTPDTLTPSAANRVHRNLCKGRAIPSFDLNAACSGFVYGLEVAGALMEARGYRHALLCGAESLTRFTDYEDRSTCVLFGDAAGAVVLERTDGDQGGVRATTLNSDGQFVDLITIPGGGSSRPPSLDLMAEREPFVRMQGRAVFKLAVQSLDQVARDTLAKVGWTLPEVDWVLSHQANRRILDAARDRLGVAEDKFPINVDMLGNTSSASVPTLLDECNRKGMFKPGDKLLLVAFGGGLTWAAAAIEWV